MTTAKRLSLVDVLFLVLTLFLLSYQIGYANGLFNDDLWHVFYFKTTSLWQNFHSGYADIPGFYILAQVFLFLKNRTLIKVFILLTLVAASWLFNKLLLAYRVPRLVWLTAPLIIYSFANNAEAVYFHAGSWVAFSIFFSLLSTLLFYRSLAQTGVVKARTLFLSWFCFAWSVSMGGQPALLPLLYGIFILEQRARLSRESLKSNGLIWLAYCACTSLFYLVLRFLVMPKNQWQKTSYSLKHLWHQAQVYNHRMWAGLTVDNYFSHHALIALVICLGAGLYLWQSFKRRPQGEKFNPWAVIFLAGAFVLTMGPPMTIQIPGPANRYFFGPSFYLFTLMLYLLYFALARWSKKYGPMIFILVSLVWAFHFSVNKFDYVTGKYILYADVYWDLKEKVDRDIPLDTLPQDSQLLILDHPAGHELSYSKCNYGEALFKNLVDEKWHNHFSKLCIGVKQDYSDFFSSELAGKKDGVVQWKTLTGFSKSHPLAVYKLADGHLLEVKYLALKGSHQTDIYLLDKHANPRFIETLKTGTFSDFLKAHSAPEAEGEELNLYPDDYWQL